ncbi:MAG: zinc ribbon domain-containing protein, partial [Acidobacteriota bacterium]
MTIPGESSRMARVWAVSRESLWEGQADLKRQELSSEEPVWQPFGRGLTLWRAHTHTPEDALHRCCLCPDRESIIRVVLGPASRATIHKLSIRRIFLHFSTDFRGPFPLRRPTLHPAENNPARRRWGAPRSLGFWSQVVSWNAPPTRRPGCLWTARIAQFRYNSSMPIFEYQCLGCKRRFEKIVFGSREDITCPACSSTQVKKLLSTFAVSGTSTQPTSAQKA